jgi:hypothetical protein
MYDENESAGADVEDVQEPDGDLDGIDREQFVEDNEF